MARKKAFVLLGHNNADGAAGSSPLLAAATHLKTDAIVTRATYKNLYVFQNKLGFSASDTSPPQYTIADGEWKEMTLQNASSPLADHPYASPYNYINTRTLPQSPPFAQADEQGGGWRTGVQLPLAWRLSHYWAEPVYLVQMAIPGSFFTRNDEGAQASSFQIPSPPSWFGWWTPRERNDFAPSTDRLYKSWFDKMTAGNAALAANNDKLDVRLVVLWLGENDAAFDTTGERTRDFEKAYEEFVKRIRHDIAEQDWSALPEHQIPVVLMGIHSVYNSAADTVAPMNASMVRIAEGDPWARYVNVEGFQRLTEAGYPENGNLNTLFFSHNGYLQAEEAIYEALADIDADSYGAIGEEDRISVETARNRVLTYYERNRVSNDATDEAVLQHLNGALQHILNHVGDGAWWLRRRHTFTLTTGPSTIMTLPKHVDRVIRVEQVASPRDSIDFEQIGFGDRGRLQIMVPNSSNGDYVIHYITQPRDLSRDAELIPLPFQCIEWLIVEACRRLARASGNLELQQQFMGESEALKASAMRNIGAMTRSRFDRPQPQHTTSIGGRKRRWPV